MFYKAKVAVFITEVETVYSAVRTESLYKTDTLRLWRVKIMKLSYQYHITPCDNCYFYLQGFNPAF
jgi:hypothetical protein